MSKRERDEEAEVLVEVAPETKKQRLDEEGQAKKDLDLAQVRTSYDRLLAWIPVGLRDDPNHTVSDAIDWRGWVGEERRGGIPDLTWLSAHLLPVTEDAVAEIAVWIWWFARRHLENHYGSFELQILLAAAVNADEHGWSTIGKPDRAKILAALEKLLVVNDSGYQRHKEPKLRKIVRRILTNREQMFTISSRKDGTTGYTLRFHSLVDDYELPE